MTWDEKLAVYKKVLTKCPRFEFKGKTVPYTSANGYMFSQLNKAGDLGIRFSKDKQLQYFQELNTTIFKSYGAIIRGYVLMPEDMWDNSSKLIEYLNDSFDYVMSLKTK